jgi:hypothetical protein
LIGGWTIGWEEPAMKSPTLLRVGVVALSIVLFFPVSGRAQIGIAAKLVYQSAAVVPTNIDGITGFRPPPNGFDAVEAADAELALHGLPPRPNAEADPEAFGHWVKAMRMLGQPATGPLVDMHITSRNLIPAGPPVTGAAGRATIDASYNWSGIANTIPGLTSWNRENSFYFVASEFNVPVAEQAFASGGTQVCSGGLDLVANWNGIDGFSNGDVLQGGSLSAASCKDGARQTQYFAWVEWFPSYPILMAFAVNPGDDMYVATWDTSATDGYVFVDDLTQGVYKTHHLKPKRKPYLVGGSAEYIVERPAGGAAYLYPLTNYVHDYWAGGYAYTFGGAEYVPGANSSATFLITMINDQGTENISTVSTAGRNGLFFSDENCALGGGCTSSTIVP